MQDLSGYYLFSSLSSRCIIPLVQGPCWTLVTRAFQGENRESRNSERKALLSVVLATHRGPQGSLLRGVLDPAGKSKNCQGFAMSA